jgi:hypothetical protein
VRLNLEDLFFSTTVDVDVALKKLRRDVVMKRRSNYFSLAALGFYDRDGDC